MPYHRLTLATSVAVLFFLIAPALRPATIYVDDSAPPGGDGSSWASAFDSLQDALDAAVAPDEIRVGQGTYRPSKMVDPTDPRSVSFVMIDGVAIFGGYAGIGATDPDERHTAAFVSRLSGDLNGDDGPDFANRSDNCYHVVFNNENYLTSAALLDGFTLSGGQADVAVQFNSGGGAFIRLSSPTLNDCTITDNWGYNSAGINIITSSTTLNGCTIVDNRAGHIGGGVIVSDSTSTLTKCTISGNSANLGGGMSNLSSDTIVTDCLFAGNDGGGMHNLDASPTIVDCAFMNNSGGGMVNDLDSDLYLLRCVFEGNTSDESGGAIANLSSSPELVNCTIRNNSTDELGGAVFNSFSAPTMTNCTISANSALDKGGAVANFASSTSILTNCIVWANSSGGPPSTDEIYNDTSSTATVTFSTVEGGFPGTGNIDADPLFADAAGGDFHLTWNSPCRDAGHNAAVTESTDFEGDPRSALGTVDMGADEYYYHLYHTGNPLPGSPIDIKVIGYPGAPVVLYVGSGIADPPHSTEHGDFHLTWPPLWQGNVGTVPADGLLLFTATVPSGWVSGSEHPLQALIGPWGGSFTRLTNLERIVVD